MSEKVGAGNLVDESMEVAQEIQVAGPQFTAFESCVRATMP